MRQVSRVLPTALLVLRIIVSGAYATPSHELSQGLLLHEARDIGQYVAEGLGLSARQDEANAASTTNLDSLDGETQYSAMSTTSSIPASSTPLVVSSLSANGTINSYALSCYSARATWLLNYEMWQASAILGKSFSELTFPTTQQFEAVTTTTIYPTNVSTYKLCDGSPRVDASPVTLTSSYNWTSYITTTITPNSPTFSPPPCSMAPQDCMYLYYNTSLSEDVDNVLLGACGSPPHLNRPCLIGGGPVRLAYFPVTTTNGDLCRGDGTTITSMEGPTTIEALGTTLTTGSVYVSFQSLFAYQEGFDIRIGPNFTDFVLPLPSSAISTQCGGWFSATGLGTAVNWADFNYPQPASAYACANRCTTELQYSAVNGTGGAYTPAPECYTIWDDFNPALAVPTEVRHLVPAWSTCSFWDDILPNFLKDPPIALRPAETLATHTLPSLETQATTTPAYPASTIFTALPETLSQAASTGPAIHTGGAPQPPNVQAVQIVFTAGSEVFTASAASGAAAHNALDVNGVTLPLGGPAQVVKGHTLSLGLDCIVVDGTSTVPFVPTSGSTSSSGVPRSTSTAISAPLTTRSRTSTTEQSATSSSTTTSGAAMPGISRLLSWVSASAMVMCLFL